MVLLLKVVRVNMVVVVVVVVVVVAVPMVVVMMLTISYNNVDEDCGGDADRGDGD